MNIDSALDFIYSAQRFSLSPELTRITELLDRLGNPQDSLKFVHIGGTNGKGSTAALMSSVLIQAGYKTGTFISPYLERFNERIQVNFEQISDEAVIELTEIIKIRIDEMRRSGFEHPTMFEIVTAMAFLYWKRCGCEIVALEVGMGGRLDATNVIKAPLVAMILSVSRDHMAKLGNTLSDIAGEKCGIIKPGTGAVISFARQSEEAQRAIEQHCTEKAVKLIVPDTAKLDILRSTLNGSDFVYKGIEYRVPLMGEHQVLNALDVIEAAQALGRLGYIISDQDIINGINNVRWQGRLEIVSSAPLCLIDAAHNFGAVKALCAALDKFIYPKLIVTVMGMLKDKEFEKCIPELAKRSCCFIATRPDNARALDVYAAAEIAKEYCAWVEAAEKITAAVDRALEIAKQADAAVIICGSLYVIGHARRYLRTGKESEHQN